MAPKAHARLAASAAERWLNCPGSIKLSESMTPTRRSPSSYADRGTALHAVSEEFFRDQRFSLTAGERIEIKDEYGIRHYEIEEDDVVPLMEYVDYVDGFLMRSDWSGIEVPLNLTDIHPDLGGTADVCCLLYNGDLIIIDLKTGRGIMVDPTENPQMLQYGLGAYNTLPDEYRRRVKNVRLIICQPWATLGPTIKEWNTDPAYLIEHAVTLMLAATAVERGNLLQPGDWCRWCPARSSCPALYKEMHETIAPAVMEIEEPKEVTLSPEKIGKILTTWSYVDGMVNGLRQYAQRLAEAGVEIPGMKLVPKRAHYIWEDETYIAEYLRGLGLAEEDIYERKLVSPAKAMKLVDKAQVPILQDMRVNTSQGWNLQAESKVTRLRGPDLTPNLPTLQDLGLKS